MPLFNDEGMRRCVKKYHDGCSLPTANDANHGEDVDSSTSKLTEQLQKMIAGISFLCAVSSWSMPF